MGILFVYLYICHISARMWLCKYVCSSSGEDMAFFHDRYVNGTTINKFLNRKFM